MVRSLALSTLNDEPVCPTVLQDVKGVCILEKYFQEAAHCI